MTIQVVRGQNKPEFIVNNWDHVDCPFCEADDFKLVENSLIRSVRNLKAH